MHLVAAGEEPAAHASFIFPAQADLPDAIVNVAPGNIPNPLTPLDPSDPILTERRQLGQRLVEDVGQLGHEGLREVGHVRGDARHREVGHASQLARQLLRLVLGGRAAAVLSAPSHHVPADLHVPRL